MTPISLEDFIKKVKSKNNRAYYLDAAVIGLIVSFVITFIVGMEIFSDKKGGATSIMTCLSALFGSVVLLGQHCVPFYTRWILSLVGWRVLSRKKFKKMIQNHFHYTRLSFRTPVYKTENDNLYLCYLSRLNELENIFMIYFKNKPDVDGDVLKKIEKLFDIRLLKTRSDGEDFIALFKRTKKSSVDVVYQWAAPISSDKKIKEYYTEMITLRRISEVQK